MMSRKPKQPNGSGKWSKPHTKIRSGLLLVLLTFSVLLQGCFLDRLITLRSQTCSFDEHFTITLGRNIELDFHDPVLLEKDMDLIWDAPPTAISRSETGSTMRYLFQRVADEPGIGTSSLLEEFSLEFNFIPVDGQLRLSKISSSNLPAELLIAANTISSPGLDEITDFACQAELNPFTRSMMLPLDRNWFKDIPARDELIALVGTPNLTLDEGNGIVYQYRLKSNDAKTHTARFVIWYGETGEKPLSVEAGFNRYLMYTDLLTAMMKVQFRI
jgi:hypothetical protein